MAAEGINVHDNTFSGDCETSVVQFVSCKDCRFVDNTVNVTGELCVPVRFEDPSDQPDLPSSQSPVVTGNSITSENNVFLAHVTDAWDPVFPLNAGNNTYISGTDPSDWIFSFDGAAVTFAEWKTESGTDSTSTTVP